MKTYQSLFPKTHLLIDEPELGLTIVYAGLGTVPRLRQDGNLPIQFTLQGIKGVQSGRCLRREGGGQVHEDGQDDHPICTTVSEQPFDRRGPSGRTPES
jgi:hypothetical protein